jgi:hypothetical protein
VWTKEPVRCGGERKKFLRSPETIAELPAFSVGIKTSQLFSLLTTGTIIRSRNFMSVVQFGYEVSVACFKAASVYNVLIVFKHGKVFFLYSQTELDLSQKIS